MNIVRRWYAKRKVARSLLRLSKCSLMEVREEIKRIGLQCDAAVIFNLAQKFARGDDIQIGEIEKALHASNPASEVPMTSRGESLDALRRKARQDWEPWKSEGEKPAPGNEARPEKESRSR